MLLQTLIAVRRCLWRVYDGWQSITDSVGLRDLRSFVGQEPKGVSRRILVRRIRKWSLFGDGGKCRAPLFDIDIERSQDFHLTETRRRTIVAAEAKNHRAFRQQRTQRYHPTMLIGKTKTWRQLSSP